MCMLLISIVLTLFNSNIFSMYNRFCSLTFLLHLTLTAASENDLGGHRQAKDGEFPFIVRVKSNKVRCIGTLVTYIKFVTAGRCFAYIDHKSNSVVLEPLNGYAVYGGTVYYFSSYFQARDVKECYIHPMFSPKPDYHYYHDIAIGVLNKPFEKNFRVKPMVVYNKEKMKAAWYNVTNQNKTCYSVGWSWDTKECDSKSEGEVSWRFGWKYLQVMKVKPMPNETCRKYASVGNDMECLGEVCTYGFNYYSGPCGGDPGSPIICDGQPLGLHIANIICGQHEIAHFYQLFWPYTSYFFSAKGFQNFLSGSDHLTINSFLLITACIWNFINRIKF